MTASPVPRLDQSICAAAGAGPGLSLRAEPAQTTLYEWSVALCRALADNPTSAPEYVPLWVAPAALQAAGLGSVIPVLLEKMAAPEFRLGSRNKTEELGEATLWSGPLTQNPPAPREISILVLVGSPSPPASSWMPSERAGVLILHPADAHGLLARPPALLHRPEVLGFQHLVLAGVTLSDTVVLEIRNLLKTDAEKAGRPFTCWELGGGSDQPELGVRGLKPAATSEELLVQLAEQAFAPTFFGRVVGQNLQTLPFTLRDWLTRPRRRARGRLKISRGGWLRLVPALLPYGMRPGEYEVGYEASPADGNPGGEPGEIVLLGMKERTGRQKQVKLELAGGSHSVSVRAGDSALMLYPSVGSGSLLFSAFGIRGGGDPSTFPLAPNPFWYFSIGAQEGGFHFYGSLELFNLTVLELQGDFAPEAVHGEQQQRFPADGITSQPR